MSAFKGFYYNEQIKNYLLQFMAIFAGMKVKMGKHDGKEQPLVNVPIIYGGRDRVVASILSENTQVKPLRLPTMSAYINSLDLAPELRKGIGTQRRNTYLPIGGAFPDDIEVVHQYMPVPYRMITELGIFTSNTDQMMQILEQVLMIFDPTLTIQTNDDVFDWAKLTYVELTGIANDQNYPSGMDRRIVQWTLSFEIPIYISAPADVRNDYIKDIYVRIGAVSLGATSSDDIIHELDQQGIDYELWFSLDDVNIT